MWRKCDLHNHTTPNDKDDRDLDASGLVAAYLQSNLQVVGLTDHDAVQAASSVIDAARQSEVVIIPGVEVSTDRGHILVLAPNDDGLEVIKEFCLVLGAAPGIQISLSQLLDVAQKRLRTTGNTFVGDLIVIGAHVDQDGSLLGSGQALSVDSQVDDALRLDALEVMSEAVRDQWIASGIKQTGRIGALIQSSDSHSTEGRVDRSTWIYLPEISVKAFRHAFATPESSIRFDSPAQPPQMWIESISFEGGLLDGRRFVFSERTNAVIGPPSSGKSLLIDTIRWALGSPCDINEIVQISEKRMSKCLEPGSKVRITGYAAGQRFELERIWGAAGESRPPFRPICFSQTELVRRAMESKPSLVLIDLHCPPIEGYVKEIEDTRAELAAELKLLIEWSESSSALSVELENPNDGLQITKQRIVELGGVEPVAKRANDISRLRSWREQVAERNAAFQPEPPSIQILLPLPTLESGELDFVRFMPSEIVQEFIEAYKTGVNSLGQELRDKIARTLSESEADLVQLEADVQSELAAGGFEEGSELLARLADYRDRLIALEDKDRHRKELQEATSLGLSRALDAVRKVATLNQQIRSTRKAACTSLNHSMRAFFARVLEDDDLTSLAGILEQAKTGTGLWAATVEEVRDSLDRERVVEACVRLAEKRADKLSSRPEMQNQDLIVEEARNRNKILEIATLATTWPQDSLDLAMKSNPPIPFTGLTEGMRALAIKEVSFAASTLPVVTDQPEDAVPSRAVFDTLVPTLRKQRAERQFILASHDANIVVAGDVERVWVMDSDDGPIEGTLFDVSIRQSALELLEGGQTAFELRSRRYASIS